MKTGRTDRIRSFMQPGRDYSLTELRDAIDRRCTIARFNTTIQALCRRGEIARNGSGRGNVRYRLPATSAQPVPVVRTPRTPAPRPPSQSLRDAMTGIARAPRRRASAAASGDANFTAAPGSVSTTHCPRRRASQQIAADIAAFERGGGRIEKLGITRVFHHPADLADND